jgi:hypothetical protein
MKQGIGYLKPSIALSRKVSICKPSRAGSRETSSNKPTIVGSREWLHAYHQQQEAGKWVNANHPQQEGLHMQTIKSREVGKRKPSTAGMVYVKTVHRKKRRLVHSIGTVSKPNGRWAGICKPSTQEAGKLVHIFKPSTAGRSVYVSQQKQGGLCTPSVKRRLGVYKKGNGRDAVLCKPSTAGCREASLAGRFTEQNNSLCNPLASMRLADIKYFFLQKFHLGSFSLVRVRRPSSGFSKAR